MKRPSIFVLILVCLLFSQLGEPCMSARPRQRNPNAPLRELLTPANTPEEKDYPEWAADQLSQLKVGVTLGNWRHNHPDEKVVRVNPSEFDPQFQRWGEWCAKTEEKHLLPDGKEARRYAFFYCPSSPPAFALPDDQDGASLLDNCILALIWIAGPAGMDKGNLAARDASKAISARFGEPGGNSVAFFGSAHWGEVTRWRVGEVSMVSAYDNQEYWPLAFGVLPQSGKSVVFSPRTSDYYIRATNRRDRAYSRIRNTMLIAGIEGTTQESIEDLLKLNESWQTGHKPDKSKMAPDLVVQSLGDWMAKAASLPPLGKAAAFLVADQVLAEVQHSFKVSDYSEGVNAREALTKLGAGFGEGRSGGICYVQNWLSAAQRMDPNGPIGNLAFRILMEAGFDTSGTCQGGSRQFEKVIEQGEKYLKTPYDSESSQAVRLMVAEAYRDIVGLAEGVATSEFADPEEYKGAALAARKKAIEHFRTALANAVETVENRADWADAWRLIAGLPPANIRFYCIYD